MRVFYLSLIVVIIDQLSKLKVKGIDIPFLNFSIHGMPYNSSISVIDNLFLITFIENPGMAFGIEIGGKLLLSIFTLIATILIIYFIWKHKNESLYLRLSLAFILGGAVGNLIDRLFYGLIYGYAPLFYGKVVDFFHVNIPDFTVFGKHFYTFPIFNVADISVTIGFFMILLGYKKIFLKNQDYTVTMESRELTGEVKTGSESENRLNEESHPEKTDSPENLPS
ncbi:MAG: signal peptidase II [Ignavibacteria bacterium]|nr:signal peptidase II [Ignavibacteria bacterium]